MVERLLYNQWKPNSEYSSMKTRMILLAYRTCTHEAINNPYSVPQGSRATSNILFLDDRETNPTSYWFFRDRTLSTSFFSYLTRHFLFSVELVLLPLLEHVDRCLWGVCRLPYTLVTYHFIFCVSSKCLLFFNANMDYNGIPPNFQFCFDHLLSVF